MGGHQRWHTSVFLKGHHDWKCVIGAMAHPRDNTEKACLITVANHSYPAFETIGSWHIKNLDK